MLILFTGLAKFASALANGPRQALGEEVELLRPKRKASLPLDGMMSKNALVDPSLGEGSSVAEKHPLKKTATKNLAKEKDPVEETFSQAFPFSSNVSGFKNVYGDSRNGFSQDLGFDKGDLDKSGCLDRAGGLEKGDLHQSKQRSESPFKYSQSSNMYTSQRSSSRSSHRSHSQTSQRSNSRSTHKLKSNSQSSHHSKSEKSHKSNAQSVIKRKSSHNMNLPQFGSSQMLFSQSSETQQSDTQRSDTQRSDTQRSDTQRSDGQLSNTQRYTIPRLQPQLSGDDLARKTAYLMGSLGKSVMEGGAVMLREYLEAANKGNNSG